MSETSRLCKMSAAAHNVSTFTIPCDVRVESDVAASLDEIVEEWERIDYAVNSASAFFLLCYPRSVMFSQMAGVRIN